MSFLIRMSEEEWKLVILFSFCCKFDCRLYVC